MLPTCRTHLSHGLLRTSILASYGIALLAAGAAPSSAFADPLNVADFGRLALRCGPSVAPSTLASIARAESGFEPLAVNDNTTRTSVVPATHDIASQLASRLLAARHSVDVGIMQINSANFQRLGLTLDAAFDPCRSISAAATIMVENFSGDGDTHERQQAALRIALSKYNTGDAQRGFANGYVRKVEMATRRVVPALDVGMPPAAIDTVPPPQAGQAAPSNTPPTWDTWEYADWQNTPRDPLSARSPVAAAPAVPPTATPQPDVFPPETREMRQPMPPGPSEAPPVVLEASRIGATE